MREPFRRKMRPLLVVVTAAAAACARRPRVAPPATPVPGESPREAGRRAATLPDFGAIYARMGLAAAHGDVPFVASVAQFASAAPDSTRVLVALSLANRSLTFEREGDGYRAAYAVRLDARDARGAEKSASVARLRVGSDETVRVATLRETTRGDESVLFYQWLTLAPAAYTLSVAVRDASSGRSATVDVPLTVARFDRRGLATPTPLYRGAGRARLDTVPDVAVRPRRTATFGEAATVPLYVEAYGALGNALGNALGTSVRITARTESGVTLWSDTATLAARDGLAARTVPVPVAPLGIGVVALDVVRQGTADSARTTLLVGLGDELPVATFDDLLGYLRYYATPERLRALRPGTWAAFARAHDDLRDYFARVRAANTRFGEDATLGWTTDRGRAYVALGEPDQIAEPAGQDPNAKGRTQRWVYRAAGLTLAFVDRDRSGRWALTAASAAQLEEALRRRLVP